MIGYLLLAELQRTRALQSDVIWTDDTHVTVLSGKAPGSTRARFWAYISEGAAPTVSTILP